MRMRVIHPRGLRYGGKNYAQGEEFEISERNTRYHAAALMAAKKAEKADPFIVGTPPPLPEAPRRRGRPPLSARPAATPEPVADAAEGARTKQTAVPDDEAAKPAQAQDEQPAPQPQRLAPLQPPHREPKAENVPAEETEDGTYQRRDLRAQE